MITLLFKLFRWLDRRPGKQYYQIDDTKADIKVKRMNW